MAEYQTLDYRFNLSDAGDWERLLEPKKFDPSRVAESLDENENALLRYKSVARKNPYIVNPSFRDTLRYRECYLPQEATVENRDNARSSKNPQIWMFPSPPTSTHPALRYPTIPELSSSPGRKQVSFHLQENQHLLNPGLKRTLSQPLSPSEPEAAPPSPTKIRFGISKSFSDSHFSTPRNANTRKDRKSTPKPLSLPIKPFGQERLAAIREQESFAMNYKVQVRQSPESDEKIVRSPLKRLFGDGGLLGRSTSAKDLPDPRYKKSGLAFWGEKMKQRVEELGKDFSEKFSFVESAHHGFSSSAMKTSTFPVSLTPYIQGDFYMQLELLLNVETNRFLMKEFQDNRLSVSSVKSIVETWMKKGRPQVLGFRYDILTQRELVYLNADNLRFAGINAFNRAKVQSVLASWKVLAKEIALHTFCQPDSAVKKHLHDAGNVLELIDASQESMKMFQEMGKSVFTELCRKPTEEREWMFQNGVGRPVNMDDLDS